MTGPAARARVCPRHDQAWRARNPRLGPLGRKGSLRKSDTTEPASALRCHGNACNAARPQGRTAADHARTAGLRRPRVARRRAGADESGHRAPASVRGAGTAARDGRVTQSEQPCQDRYRRASHLSTVAAQRPCHVLHRGPGGIRPGSPVRAGEVPGST